MGHAKLSPSSSPRWTLCAAAPSREDGCVDESSEFADWGTVAHDLSEKRLKSSDDTLLDMYKGKWALVDAAGDVTYFPNMPETGSVHLIDDEMLECAIEYTQFVLKLAQGGELMVEQRLSIEHITGEPDAKGTSDSVILFPKEICIIDLKGGMGVKVFASEAIEPSYPDERGALTRKPNTQLLMYGDSALEEFGMFGDFERVRLIVVQPRLGHVDEFVMDIEEHRAWVQWVRERAEATRQPNAPALPGEKQCQFCKAKATCPELQQLVFAEALGDFDSLEDADVRNVETHELGAVYAKIDLIKGFCKAIEERAYSELDAGKPVIGYKLVDGKAGNRAWSDKGKVVTLLKSFKLKSEQIYKPEEVVTPPTVEKLLKKKPDQWEQVQALIVRPPSTPTIAKESDPRPPISRNHADDFEDESTPNPATDLAEFF